MQMRDTEKSGNHRRYPHTLQNSVSKNYIQMKRAGRTITYEILITEEDYKSEQAREFVAFWNNGSLKQFITAFYKDEPASKAEIEELRKAIEELDE